MSNVDTIARFEASISDGGWHATGAVFNDADLISFYQQITAWFDLYAGGWEASPRPAFTGHLIPEPWQKIFQSSIANWNAFSPQEIMKQGDNVQGIFYKNVASSPANRHQIISMKYAKIVYELISGHCNLMLPDEAVNYDSQLWSGAFTSQTFDEGFLELDLDITNSSSVNTYELKAGNFWQRIQEIADIDFYVAYIGRDGVFHFVPHPMFDATLPNPVITLDSSLLLEPLRIERHNTELIGQVQIFGSTPQGLQISGKYPTNPGVGGIVVKSGYLADSAALMNTIAERMYRFGNRDYRIVAKIAGAVGLLIDLFDRLAVTYTSSSDSIAWSSKKFWVDQITVEIMSDFNAATTLVLDAEN